MRIDVPLYNIIQKKCAQSRISTPHLVSLPKGALLFSDEGSYTSLKGSTALVECVQGSSLYSSHVKFLEKIHFVLRGKDKTLIPLFVLSE